MKTKKNLLVACFVGLALTFGIAGASFAGQNAAGAGIVGSSHDMRIFDTATPDAQNRVCAYCHTPHHAEEWGDDGAYMPLWSRPDMAKATFSSYDSVTFDGNKIDNGDGTFTDTTMGDPLWGPSRLCMSCHDGIVAIDSYYGATGDATTPRDDDDYNGISLMDGGGATGGLSNDHPIGFDYAAVAGQDAEIIAAPTFATSGIEVTSLLTDGAMTCATCHDVHNTQAVEDYFLYESQAGSALCLTCHNKNNQ